MGLETCNKYQTQFFVYQWRLRLEVCNCGQKSHHCRQVFETCRVNFHSSCFSECFGIVFFLPLKVIPQLFEKVVHRKATLKICGNSNPASVYLFRVNDRNTKKWCEICAKLIINNSHWRHCGVFIVNFEHVSYLFLVFQLLTLNR